jgi:cell division protein FtsB
MRNRRIMYIVILLATVGLAVTYFERRQLQERYEAFQQGEREIEDARAQILELEKALAEEEARARNLVSDPVEVEAAIRRIKRGVRDGETVFRVEASPAQPAEAAPAPPAGARP